MGNAPLAVDIFLIVLVGIVPLMGFGMVLARRRRYAAHAAVMVTCFALFLVSVVAFEWSVRASDEIPPLPLLPLVIHLCLALPCAALWVRQVLSGKRAHENPTSHKRRGRFLLALLVATVATGAWVYVATFG